MYSIWKKSILRAQRVSFCFSALCDFFEELTFYEGKVVFFRSLKSKTSSEYFWHCTIKEKFHNSCPFGCLKHFALLGP